MAHLDTLRDGLLDELKDLYSAEHQLLKALPKMEKKASEKKLKEAFTNHLKETQTQVDRLDEIAVLLDRKLTGKICKAMQGLVEEGKEVLEQESDNGALLDALLIGAARRVEHYEMAAYSTAWAMAKTLGEDKVAKLLSTTLAEETAAEKKLDSISEGSVLREAKDFSDGEERNEDEPSSNGKSRTNGNVKRKMVIGLLAMTCLASSRAYAETTSPPNASKDAAKYEADNTGKNERDQHKTLKTADDQTSEKANLEVLTQLRKNVVANDALSTNAKNVKIIVDQGIVTLRGPVKSIEEKNWIDQEVVRTAKGYKVVNELEIAN